MVLAGWLLVAAVGVLAGLRLLRGAPLPAWPLAALLLLVDAVVFAAAGERQLFAAANWVWGTLGWFFVLVLWGRRVSGLIALLGAHALIALAGVLGHGATAPADLARYAMYVYGTSTLPVAVFVGGTAIATLARQRAGAAAAAHAAAAERDAAERARRERRARLTLVSGAAEEVLAELADGRADPADPDVQRRARAGRRPAAPAHRRVRRRARPAAARAAGRRRPGGPQRAADRPGRRSATRRRCRWRSAAGWPTRSPRTLADARGWARLTVVAGPDEVVVSLVTPDRAGPDSRRPARSDDGRVEYLYERDGEHQMGADPVAGVTGGRPVGVAIVDDHPVVIEGVRAWLAAEPRLTGAGDRRRPGRGAAGRRPTPTWSCSTCGCTGGWRWTSSPS